MTQAATLTMDLHVSDVTGQKNVKASAVPAHYTIAELVQRLIAKMGLARTSSGGQPLAYHARLDREGRHLHGTETVGDALRTDDELVLTPDIDAGRGAAIDAGSGACAAAGRGAETHAG
jgi:hypothetical protein